MISDKHYILEGKEPKEATLQEWGNWFNTADRHVDRTQINGKDVSTVFLGLDHNYGPGTTPVLFETMIFGLDGHDEYCERYCTWEEAEAGHAKAIQWVKDGCKDD